jgi:subtilisin family serine protease/subtilisin-like proprotein convertase family protein
MSSRISSRRSMSLPQCNMMDTLEARVLLSAVGETVSVGPMPVEPAANVAHVSWRGLTREVVPGSWLVTSKEPLDQAAWEARISNTLGEIGMSPDSVTRLGLGYSAQFNVSDSIGVFTHKRLKDADPLFRTLEPDGIYQQARIPNDPDLSSQWVHDNSGQFVANFPWFVGFGTPGADVNSIEAWDITIGSRDVIVAVIDTGVDVTHPDLEANIWRNPGEIPGNGIDDDGNGFVDDYNGWDFGQNDNNPADVDGHGTGASGLIGAVGNNGIGRVGVAWEVSILPLKISNSFNQLTFAAIVSAHDYLTMMINDFGHNIVASNNSYGGFDQSIYTDLDEDQDPEEVRAGEQAAIQRFIQTGAAFVASAGNSAFNTDNEEFTNFPSSYNLPGIISVAATAPDDTLAAYSNFGPRSVDLAAPGIAPGSLAPGGGYQPFGGTSAAGPVVAGAIALLKSVRPDASAEELLNILSASSDPLPGLQNRIVSGGRINIANALRIVGLDGPVVRRVEPGPITGRLDSTTGNPIDQLVVVFNKDLDESVLSTSSVQLTFAGNDGNLGTGDDIIIPIVDVRLPDIATDSELILRLADGERTKTILAELDLAGLPQQRLPLGDYSMRLFSGTTGTPLIRDTDGNLLNGSLASGTDEVYGFEVIDATGSLEQNDTIALATPINFVASGTANFTGLFLGDGNQAGLDVDLFRINMSRGGLISAKVIAQQLSTPSSLDAQLRLFDALGEEIASNDQSNGFDPAIDYFVTTGGTYYLGVSGYNNDDYDPFLAGSGSTQSTGGYSLEVVAELIGDSRFPAVSPNLVEPLAIPDGGQIVSTVNIPDAREILDVNLRVDIEHPFVGDLTLTLVSPSGQSMLLVNRQGGSSDDIKVLFDDEASVQILSAPVPFTGSLRPEQALSIFDGESAEGTWTLVVRDNRGGDVGVLVDWSLELTLSNDIFGPFELNDTPSTAHDLEIDGIGSASLEAAIGDGGFGLFDRDLFEFTASAGSTLNVSAISLPGASDNATLNTALRLFDRDGNPLVVSNPAGTLNSSIESFVFPDGGVYILAVSESNNVSYDPFSVTSGAIALTTGNYSLSVTVSTGVSDTAGVLTGAATRVGIGSDGTFGASNNSGQISTIVVDGIEFVGNELTPTSGRSFFGAISDGASFLNDGSGSAATLPLSLTDQSDHVNSRLNAQGRFRTLKVERTVSFGNDDRFVSIDVTLTNDGLSAVSGVAWMEGFNPNHGYSLLTNSASTINDIDNTRPYASASVITNTLLEGKTIALAAPASDTRARVDFVGAGLQLRDPSLLINSPQNDPNGLNQDQVMIMSFDVGDIAPGQTQTLRYFVLVEDSPAETLAIYDAINAGTTAGHLAADTANPATVQLSDGTAVPDLPYRAYYPEGFASSTTSHFLPMLNPHNQATRVVVVARYEDLNVERDSLIADFVIDGQRRGGVTLTTPIFFANGTSLVRTDLLNNGFTAGYAIEVWSERPISTTFSYYDEFNAGRSALGENFTSQPSEEWTFPEVVKGSGRTDVVVFQNTTDRTIKVEGTFLTADGPLSIRPVFELQPYRRGGFNLNDISALPAGTYAMMIEADGEIVASLSSFDSGIVSGQQTASGVLGAVGNGTATGAVPEGQIGLNAETERLGVVNPNTVGVNVEFTFIFQSGASYRTSLAIPAQSRANLDVAALPGFPTGQPYGVSYAASDQSRNPLPVAITLPTDVFGDTNAATLSAEAYSLWAFGEGFRPTDPLSETVTEYLRLFNPNSAPIIAEVQIRFDGFFTGTTNPLGQETFRFTIPARRVLEVDVHELVTGARRDQNAFYGLTIRSRDGLVAYMGRFDSFFPGGFGTLGTPLGRASTI